MQTRVFCSTKSKNPRFLFNQEQKAQLPEKLFWATSRVSIVVRTVRFHRTDRGSIPRPEVFFFSGLLGPKILIEFSSFFELFSLQDFFCSQTKKKLTRGRQSAGQKKVCCVCFAFFCFVFGVFLCVYFFLSPFFEGECCENPVRLGSSTLAHTEEDLFSETRREPQLPLSFFFAKKKTKNEAG